MCGLPSGLYSSQATKARELKRKENPLIELKSLQEIAGAETDWLKAKHHFAIGRFGNPGHKPVGHLYVLNDDEIAPHKGFGMHSHADVEIVTYVRTGVVSHTDSLGNEGRLETGDVQVISAGNGIQHAEQNPSNTPTKIFQLWLRPRVAGGAPRWGTRSFPKADRAGCFTTLASGRGTDGSLELRCDAEVLGASLLAGTITHYDLRPDDLGYLVVSSGAIRLNGVTASTGEGIVLRQEATIRIEALQDSELVFVVTSPE